MHICMQTHILTSTATLHGTGRGCCGRRAGGALLQHSPVKHVIIVVVKRAEQYAEQLSEVHVVRSLVEAQTSAVVQVHGKFCRVALTEDLDRCRHLLLTDLLILLLLGSCLEVLPRQAATVE